MKSGFRQSMAWLHTWSGLLVGCVLFAVFLTGTAAYLRPEITRWMRPEVPAGPVDPMEAGAAAVRRMQGVAPSAPSWFFVLPDGREAFATAYWRAPPGSSRPFNQAALDPRSGEILQDRDTRGGVFFYRFHFELYHMPVLWGRWIVSICAMFMLVAIVSGIVTHRRIFADFFTFRPGKGKRSWMDGHAVAAVLALPYHLMITYTGLVTLMVMTLPWGIAASYGAGGGAAFNAEIAGFTAPRRAGQPAPLADVAPMLAEARQRWGVPPARMNVVNPGDANATVVLARGASNGLADGRAGMAFNGATGAKLAEWGDGGAASRTRAVMVGLHEGLFAGPLLRALLVLSGAAGTVMVATGCVLWAVKERQKAAQAGRGGLGLRLVEVLNVAAIAGLPIAMAAFFWGNRLLPLRMADRAEWEIHVFFAAWGASLLHALIRPRHRAWAEQWTAAALLCGLLPVVNALTTNRHLGVSLRTGDWGMAGMDLGFLALGLALGAVAWASAGPRLRRAGAAWRTA